MVMLNVIGQCGPFLGTNVFPDKDAPTYARGLWICAAFMFFNTFLALSLRTLLVWENGRLDKKYGTVEERRAAKKESEASEFVAAEENYGADYRYML